MSEQEGRYHIYRVRGEQPYLVATADESGLGAAIVTMGQEGEFEGCRLGILDGNDRTWLINPWSGLPKP